MNRVWFGIMRHGIFAVVMLFVGAALSQAQITTVGNDTATPIAGSGHDYRQMLSEIVSPANGSLSVRIQVPVPKSRGITIPFSFDYDSAGVNHLFVLASGLGVWYSGSGYLNSGGWTYGIPLLTSVPLQYQYGESKTGSPLYCVGQHDFVFANSVGERHALTSLNFVDVSPSVPACVTSGNGTGDDRYLAQVTSGATPLIEVADHDGTVFTFNPQTAHDVSTPGSSATSLPSTIEDRNGNVVTVSDPGSGAFTFTDSAGRAALSSSGFAAAAGTQTNLTVSGMSAYQVTWGTASSNYTVAPTVVIGNDCNGFNSVTGSMPVVTAITLPNGQSYQFQYDPTYGLLSKVIYPNGAYSRYTWGLNNQAEQSVWQTAGANSTLYCTYDYAEPAVQHRYVSFDGTNEVLEEDYTYGTTWSTSNSIGNSAGWTAKTSTVTTTVHTVSGGSLQTIGSFATIYNYTPYTLPRNAFDISEANAGIANQVPLEQSITYGDFSGKTLKTITKKWQDQYLMSSETTALNDTSTSEIAYTYNPNSELATEMEYGYGSGTPGGLIKKIAVNYQAFADTPIFPGYASILDRPCQVITYDSSGTNRVAEADYFYDGGSTTCAAAGTPSVTAIAGVTGHDETNYASTVSSARGNLTQISNQILQPSATLVSTFTFDETGQVTSAKDPLNNITSYSHVDSFASGTGSASGQTNAYLTKLTLPSTTSGTTTINHVENFTYRYSDGQLASSSDQNSQTTNYSYNDPFGRLTETDFPDGGKTTETYNDSGATPSVTTNTLLTGSSYMTTKTVMDAAGHATETQLTSDPSGTVYTDTTYDGLGRALTKSNPYRTTGEATYGITSYQYDALGRTLQVTTSDGAVATTSYSGPTATMTDQAGHARAVTSDALGRLTAVTEDPGTGTHLNYGTTYAYDALDDLTGVTQSTLTRSFGYDSLKRLTSATNPESGTIAYVYDKDGNVYTKTDNRGIVTTFSYDSLNRVSGKTYSDGTPSVTYTYDVAGASKNGVGRLSTVSNSASATSYSQYDAMGRVLASSQVTGAKTYAFSYGYNVAGDLTSESYPSGRTVSFSFDAANRLNFVSGQLAGVTTTYAGNFSYAAFGQATGYQYGNGLGRVVAYNPRLQIQSFTDQLNESNSLPVLAAAYTWNSNSASVASNNNGNLLTATYM